MDKLLLPEEEEEARWDHSSHAPGEAERTMGDRVKTVFHGTETFWSTAKGYLKRNGLLTLSIISVVTGCTLGFTLRGTHLSTQVTFESPAGTQSICLNMSTTLDI